MQTGVIWWLPTGGWKQPHYSLARTCREQLLRCGWKKQTELKIPAGPGGPSSSWGIPKVAEALRSSCLKAVTSSFPSTGTQGDKGSSLACLLHTSGTDMEPILQNLSHVPLPLEDFSKTRLPAADLQRFLKPRGDSREATNYVDEEPDSKQCLFSL